jgi:hypothetical protein
MTVELEKESNVKVLNVKVSGKLSKEDYQKFVPKAEQLIEKFGKIRILFEMQDFHGWDAGALWEDVKFDVKHFSGIERLAFVGDKTWEKGMSIFCRPFTTAKIRYFEPAQRQQAIEWLKS